MVIKETIITDVKVKGIGKAGEDFEKLANTVTHVGDRIRKSTTKINGGFKKGGETIERVTTSFKKFERIGVSFTPTMRMHFRMWDRQMRAMKKFHAEYLSAMFGFQMLSRGMQALLSPSFEIVGVFELLSTTLQVVFLPIALLMMDILIPILSLFMEMPDSLKMALGALVVVIGGIAALGAVFFASKLFLQGFNNSIPMLATLLESLGISTGTLATKTIDLTGALGGLAKIGLITIGIALAKDAFDDFKQGKILEGILDALKAGASIGFAVGKLSGRSFAQIFIGALVAEDMVKQFQAGEMLQTLGDAIILSGIATSRWHKGVGLALIAFGVGVRFIEPIQSTVDSFVNKVKDRIGSDLAIKAGPIGKLIKPVTYQHGTYYVPETGIAMLHKGEAVIPSNQSFTSSPTINIYTTGGVDNFSLNQIQDIIARELASISRR